MVLLKMVVSISYCQPQAVHYHSANLSQTNNNKPCHIFYIILLFLLSQGIPGLPGIAGLNGQKVISCQGYSFIM